MVQPIVDTAFKPGMTVKVQSYGGEILMRCVVRDAGRSIIVCRESEYLQAVRDGRRPNGIGFPRSAVEVYNRYGKDE
jgi:hypothetical protein